jgi:DNA-binding response OmpR family regulator
MPTGRKMSVRHDHPRTVLVADDDRWLRGLLMELLEDEGFLPLEAGSGPDAVRLARQCQPDAIILDVGLPGRSGLQVLQDLRAREQERPIPVVLVSGRVDLVESGHVHDGEAAFHKPLDVGALLNSLDTLTAR